MQPVGADDKIKTTWRRLLEYDPNAIAIFVECGNRVIEQIADTRPSRLVQDRREIAAENLIFRHDASSAEGMHRHFGAMPSQCVDPGDASLVDAHSANLVEQTHAFHDSATRTTKIDSLPARTWGRCPFYDGDAEASLA